MLNQALGSRLLNAFLAIALLCVSTGCDELLNEKEEDAGDLSGFYELKYVKESASSQCTIGASASGCKITGAATDMLVYDGSLFLAGDLPTTFNVSASGLTSTGTNKSYSYPGVYIQKGTTITFSGGAYSFEGTFSKPGTIRVTVPSKLFATDANSISTVLLTFEKHTN